MARAPLSPDYLQLKLPIVQQISLWALVPVLFHPAHVLEQGPCCRNPIQVEVPTEDQVHMLHWYEMRARRLGAGLPLGLAGCTSPLEGT